MIDSAPWAAPLLGAALVLVACDGGSARDRARAPAAQAAASDRASTEWPAYGNDPGGSRYVDLDDISRENVGRVELAWSFRTGDDSQRAGPSELAFEVTPILVEDTLYLCTPSNRVIALDPATGVQRWSYDPHIPLAEARYANQLVCRGVAYWRDPHADGACAARILTATNDARLIALDARTGAPCSGFGARGEVDLARGVGEIHWRGEYQVTSPPVLVGDVVAVGSAISDNYSVDAPSGVLRGFDARTGELRWAWDLAPPEHARGAAGWALGTPNVWAPMSVDEARGLLFVPTGNPSPDYYRDAREVDAYGSSVVALRGATGELVWHFQTVHHDLWDYDVPAQPTLVTIARDGKQIPALVQATKMGLLFVLNRETGEPLFPVEERPVPQDGAPGERLSPTQPFPLRPLPLVRHTFGPDDAFGLTPLDGRWCRNRSRELRSEGIYTPPTLQGSLMLPGNAGGSNWGGVAVDPVRQLVVANVSDLPFAVTLLPRADYERARGENPGVEIAPQLGTPYAMRREPLLSPLGIPCIRPPWGTLAAVDLASGEIRWQVRLGTSRDILPLPIAIEFGTPNIGGPLVTAGGLVFIAAAMDDTLRAFDLMTGEELWQGRLPAGGQATPMSYRAGGRQYVVIAAGGHQRAGTRLGDYVLAYALPDSL